MKDTDIIELYNKRDETAIKEAKVILEMFKNVF